MPLYKEREKNNNFDKFRQNNIWYVQESKKKFYARE